MLIFFRCRAAAIFIAGRLQNACFALILSRFGLSFELSVKVLIASKTSGMTHAEPFGTAVTKSQSRLGAAAVAA